MSDTKTMGFTEDMSLETVVFTALGAASVCWENMEGTGVFDDRRAKEIGDELVEFLEARVRQPRLGLATTRQLTRELDARAEVAQVAGETWPSYRTVDP